MQDQGTVSFDLKDTFDFDGNPEWQGWCRDRRARVFPDVT
jgi:hypothetical protein